LIKLNVAFQDLVPQPLNYTGPPKTFFGSLKVPQFETFEDEVATANEWIAREGATVVETMVLPHVFISDAKDLSKTDKAIVAGLRWPSGSNSSGFGTR
jgi:hypothetical protein